MSFIGELKRRNVVRVAIGYLAGAWFLAQIADIVIPAYGLPESWVGVLISILAIGLVPVLVGAWLFELTPQGLKRDTGKASRPTTHQWFDRVVMVLLVLAVGFFAFDKFVLDPARDAERVEAARAEGRVQAVLDQYEDKSIVVLPFENLSSDPEQAYFADGLSEELLNLMAQISGLRVISRSTAITFKGQDITIPEIARKLNVSHVLEGSVRKAGNQIRVTAQLIEGPTDTHLWSQTYNREFEDVFAIQDEISAHVVEQLRLQVLGEFHGAEKVDPEAYELYLQAMHMVNNSLEPDLELAEAKLRRAVEIEPEFIPAWYYLASIAHWGGSEEGLQKSRQIVQHYSAIAPLSSYANHMLGWFAFQFDRDYEKAAYHYEIAIADDPLKPIRMLRIVSRLLAKLGRYEEAVGVSRFDLRRNPSCSMCTYHLAWILRKSGRHREGAEELETIREWQPPSPDMYWSLGVAWLVAGEPQRALDYFDRITQWDQEWSSFARLFALHDLGRREEFEAEFREWLAEGEIDAQGHEDQARIYAWTGQNDKAFMELERMVEAMGPESAETVLLDLYARLRPDPRWQAFLDRYGVRDEIVNVEFDPPFPPDMRAAIDRYGQPIETAY